MKKLQITHPPQRDSHKMNHHALSYGKRQTDFFYPTANTKHAGFMALLWIESFPLLGVKDIHQ